ncbi:MAG: site-2 protease family protein [Opitutales bacterium]
MFGIRLEMHASFLLLLLFVAWNGFRIDGVVGALGYGVYLLVGFTCVVLHELGHSLAARALGIPTRRIWLLPVGGMAELATMPRRPRWEFLITIAGPLVNFALVGLVAALLYLLNQPALLRLDPAAIQGAIHRYDLSGLAAILLLWNLGMGLFNLLPLFPMDGGRLLRAVLSHYTGSHLRATRITVWIGKPFFVALILLTAYTGNWLLVLLLLLVMFLGELEWRVVRQKERFVDLAVGHFTARSFHLYPVETTLAEALDILQFQQPPEIVLRADGRLVGLFTPADILRLASAYPLETPLRGLLPLPQALQSHWPLSMLGQQLERSTPQVFPVYRHEELLGFFRLHDLDRLMEFHRVRLRHAASPRPGANPDPSAAKSAPATGPV